MALDCTKLDAIANACASLGNRLDALQAKRKDSAKVEKVARYDADAPPGRTYTYIGGNKAWAEQEGIWYAERGFNLSESSRSFERLGASIPDKEFAKMAIASFKKKAAEIAKTKRKDSEPKSPAYNAEAVNKAINTAYRGQKPPTGKQRSVTHALLKGR